jgi:2-oxoglutarate ferredoxin oxidoreductase subunit beta
VREHRNELNEVGFVPFFNEIQIEEEFEPGTTKEIRLHDGSMLVLKKLEDDYNPSDDIQAIRTLHEQAKRGQVLTGVFYANTEKKNFLELLNMVDEPLATLPDSRICPPEAALQEVMQELR